MFVQSLVLVTCCKTVCVCVFCVVLRDRDVEPIFFFSVQILNRTLVDKTDESVPLNADEDAGKSWPACSVSIWLPPRYVYDSLWLRNAV